MKLIHKTLLIATVATAALSLAAADTASNTPTRPEGRGRPVPPMIAALDANGDGVIDAVEISNAAVALAKLDTNGDGSLSMDELRPARPEGGPGDRRDLGNREHRGSPGAPGGKDGGKRRGPGGNAGGPEGHGRGPRPDAPPAE